MKYRVYGVTLAVAPDIAPMLAGTESDAAVDVAFECTSTDPRIDLGPGKIVFDRGPIRISRHGDGHVMTFADSTVHYVLQDRIVCHLRRDEHRFLVPIQLLGMVMATWLEGRGGLALHASAVELSGAAHVFVAGAKAGKTSLAAELVRAGARFLSEDLVHISQADGGFEVAPAYPRLRMWPETAGHFLGSADGLPLYHPEYRKVWVSVDRLGRFARRAVPLQTIYVPERMAAEPVARLEALNSSLEEMKAVMRGSFLADMMEPAFDPAVRLARLAELVASVRVKKLIYPEGLESLHLVREVVEGDGEGAP